MHRNSLTDMSARSMHQAVRMALTGKINDGPMWQELDFGGFLKDGRQFVERVQAFGFSAVPLPPIVKKALGAAGGGGGGKSAKSADGVTTFADGGGGDGGGDGSGGSAMPEAAEGIAIFMGGQRNHPVVIAVDDRRHRPMGMKPGENAQYDDIQQMTLMRRNGLYLLSNDNPDAEGKTAERMVSLRHVEKDKQERKLEQQRNMGGQQQQQSQQQEDFKHEGKTVNTEVRVTKKRVEFRDGDNVKGYYDKQSQAWNHNGKTHTINASDKVDIGNKVVNIAGSTSININGPTNVNGSPVATSATVAETIAGLEARIAALEARLAAQ
jgi:phage gp45-like